MKFNRWKFIKDKMYEIYFYLKEDGFIFALCIANIDFEIHLSNLNSGGEE